MARAHSPCPLSSQLGDCVTNGNGYCIVIWPGLFSKEKAMFKTLNLDMNKGKPFDLRYYTFETSFVPFWVSTPPGRGRWEIPGTPQHGRMGTGVYISVGNYAL